MASVEGFNNGNNCVERSQNTLTEHVDNVSIQGPLTSDNHIVLVKNILKNLVNLSY